jgi:hypothetical protein
MLGAVKISKPKPIPDYKPPKLKISTSRPPVNPTPSLSSMLRTSVRQRGDPVKPH